MVGVRIDSDLTELTRRVEGSAARAIERPLRRHAKRILAAARAAWPVDTGRSSRSLRVDVYLTTSGVVVEAVVRATYGDQVRARGEPRGASWRRLVELPMLDLGTEATPELVRELELLIEAKS